MVKKPDLKEIVAQIKKLADSPPPLDAPEGAGGGGAPRGGASGGWGGGGGGASAVADIKAMQQAMQNFAQAVTKYSFTKPQKPGDKPQVDDSKKPFNDFITETYMADSPIKGQEFSPDAARQKQQEKQPTD